MEQLLIEIVEIPFFSSPEPDKETVKIGSRYRVTILDNDPMNNKMIDFTAEQIKALAITLKPFATT